MSIFDYILYRLLWINFEEEKEIELTEVPEEIYYSITEVEQELPF